jgi:DNA-binding transcriptional regulator YiaG
MLFNIEKDEGNRIVGYLVPDSFSESPSLRISDGERDLLILPCQEERAALVFAGRHSTGQCGFTIDETMIADLSRREVLELYDKETNILIYRRRPKAIQKRIFRLETHLVPLWMLDDSLDSHFQYHQKGIERHGRETATQVFLLSGSSSLYLSGRLLFKTYDNYINETFNCIALLRDPFMELAERLLALKLVRRLPQESQLLDARDMLTYAPAIEFAEGMGSGERQIHRAFETMPKAAIANLANPMTRQLAARSLDEAPRKGAVATALQTLSTFAIVGLREGQDLFLAQFANLLGISEQALPVLPEFSQTGKLCEMLRGVPEVELLIEQDLEVYHSVKSAIEAALSD